MRKSFYIRFNRNNQQVEMKLRHWARDNQHCFPNFRFKNTQDDHPTTHQIRDFCVKNLNARIDENEYRVLIYI